MLVQVTQNSPEWLEFRSTRIGASDVPIIMGKSPYKTALELWREKKGEIQPKNSQNPAINKGHEYEPIARKIYEDATGLVYSPAVFVRNTLDYLMASLDGYNYETRTAVEIKYQGLATHLSDVIAEHYMIQMQTQMLVSGCTMVYLISYNPEALDSPIRAIEVTADKKMQSEILAAVIKFKQSLDDGIPPDATSRDYVELDLVSYATELIERYKAASQKRDEAQEECDLVRATLGEVLDQRGILAAKYGSVKI